MGYLGFLSKTCCLFVPDIRIGAFQCILPSIFIWGQPLSKTFEPVYLWQKDWHCWHKNCWFKKSDAGGWVVINLILYSCVAIKIPCHYQDGERVPLNTFTHIVNQQYIMQNKVTGKGVLKNALFSSNLLLKGRFFTPSLGECWATNLQTFVCLWQTYIALLYNFVPLLLTFNVVHNFYI